METPVENLLVRIRSSASLTGKYFTWTWKNPLHIVSESGWLCDSRTAWAVLFWTVGQQEYAFVITLSNQIVKKHSYLELTELGKSRTKPSFVCLTICGYSNTSISHVFNFGWNHNSNLYIGTSRFVAFVHYSLRFNGQPTHVSLQYWSSSLAITMWRLVGEFQSIMSAYLFCKCVWACLTAYTHNLCRCICNCEYKHAMIHGFSYRKASCNVSKRILIQLCRVVFIFILHICKIVF